MQREVMYVIACVTNSGKESNHYVAFTERLSQFEMEQKEDGWE